MSNPTVAPLIDKLINELAYPLLDLDTIDDFLSQHDYSVLFFTQDVERFPESNDVAVVLPELIKTFPQMTPAIISRNSEQKLQSLYGFRSWPALVFMKGCEYLGAMTGIQDWGDYLSEIPRILAAKPSRPPSIGIPIVLN